MIHRTGNILACEAQAYVNPVNCVGVMGAGLALQFKLAYPKMFRDYRLACELGKVAIGSVWPFDRGLTSTPRWIINFPTKRHWRDVSEIDSIDRGLVSLKWFLADNEIKSVAIPALGCGLGGLDWVDVKASIERSLDGVNTTCIVYGPQA